MQFQSLVWSVLSFCKWGNVSHIIYQISIACCENRYTWIRRVHVRVTQWDPIKYGCGSRYVRDNPMFLSLSEGSRWSVNSSHKGPLMWTCGDFPDVWLNSLSKKQSTVWWLSNSVTCARYFSDLPGPWFNIKMSYFQYRKSHCGAKTILRPSYLHNGISYTGKTASLCWIGALGV